MLKWILNEDTNNDNVTACAQAQITTLTQCFSDLQIWEDEMEIIQNKDGEEVDSARQDQDEIFNRLQASYQSWLTKCVHQPPAMGPLGQPAMQSIVGINFNVTKMLTEKFSGKDLFKYTEFRIYWDLIDSQLDLLGFGNTQKLIELKKCVSGQALDTINRLPLDDGNYQNALDLLDRMFKRPTKFAKLVVLNSLNAPKMGNESRSITATLNVIEQAEQALDGLC
jgi:hypothetical protein